jgi:hypothetical protein
MPAQEWRVRFAVCDDVRISLVFDEPKKAIVLIALLFELAPRRRGDEDA